MPLSFTNPYAEKIAEKIKEEDALPQDERHIIRAEIEELRKESYAFTQKKISEYSGRLTQIKDEKQVVATKISDGKQDMKSAIKEVSNLYKNAVQLYLELREMRRHLKEQEEK